MKKVFLTGVFILSACAGWVRGQTCMPNGDMNCDAVLTAADVVILANTVFSNSTNCDNSRGDLNCDGFRDAADIVGNLYCVFTGSPPLGPCPISNVRPLAADPRDSVIIESKVVTPGSGSPYMNLRIYITNKDKIAALALPLTESTNSGDAYAVLATPRTFNGVVTPLTNTLHLLVASNFSSYNNNSPDSFVLGGFWDPSDPTTLEPPNVTRKAIWDIKFGSVTGSVNCSQILFDSTRILDNTLQFVDENGRRVPVNFLQGLVTVTGTAAPTQNLTLQMIPYGNVVKGNGGWVQMKCINSGGGPANGIATWTLPPDVPVPPTVTDFPVLAFETNWPYNNMTYYPEYNYETRSVSWCTPTLSAFQQSGDNIYFAVKYLLPCVGNPTVGTPLTSTGRLEPITIDTDPADNSGSETRNIQPDLNTPCNPLLASPPADASRPAAISPGRGEKLSFPVTEALLNDTLYYLVVFYNTGPDTAGQVIVRDTLDANLDETTLETTASSHPYTFSLNGREAVWTFSNIGLPDSARGGNSSIGFVSYTVLPKSTAPAGSEVKNYAWLYFDANPAVSTDTTSLLLCAAAKGDMNGSGDLSGADVVLMLTCAFSGSGRCDLCFADVNCSGGLTAADVVLELNMVFLSAPPGC